MDFRLRRGFGGDFTGGDDGEREGDRSVADNSSAQRMIKFARHHGRL